MCVIDQRTHLRAKGLPLLLPAVIDATRDAEARVPDSFTEVQWTRLAGTDSERTFAARVATVLRDEGAGGAAPLRSPSRGGETTGSGQCMMQ